MEMNMNDFNDYVSNFITDILDSKRFIKNNHDSNDQNMVNKSLDKIRILCETMRCYSEYKSKILDEQFIFPIFPNMHNDNDSSNKSSKYEEYDDSDDSDSNSDSDNIMVSIPSETESVFDSEEEEDADLLHQISEIQMTKFTSDLEKTCESKIFLSIHK